MSFFIKHWYISLILLGVFGYVVWDYTSTKAEIKALKIKNTDLDDKLEAAGLEINKCNDNKVLIENVAKNRLGRIDVLTKLLDADRVLRDPRNARCVPITE